MLTARMEGNDMTNKFQTSNIIRYTIVTVIGFVMIYPVLWLISSSFKPNSFIFVQPGLIPSSVTIHNYIQGWEGLGGVSFGHFLGNSSFISILAVIGNVVSCSLTGYAFA